MAEWRCRGLQILVQRFDSAAGLHLTKPLKLGLSRIRRAPLGGKSALPDVAKENGGFLSVPKPSRMFPSNTRNTMFDRCSGARQRSFAKTQTRLPETLAGQIARTRPPRRAEGYFRQER